MQPGRLGSALVALVTIVDEELTAVRAVDRFEDMIEGTSYFFRNRIGDKRYDVVLAQSETRSNIPCSELVADLTERFRPEFIVLSGIAGGVSRDDVSLGDVIVADHVEYYEFQKLVGGKSGRRRLPFDHPSKLLRETIARRVVHTGKWKARVRAPRPNAGEPKAIVGNLIAGEKILGDGESAYQKQILDEFDTAIAVDMESYGLGRGAYSARSIRHYNLNYLVVRGISDMVDAAENNEMRVRWRAYAASTAAAFAMASVDEIVAACKNP